MLHFFGMLENMVRPVDPMIVDQLTCFSGQKQYCVEYRVSGEDIF